MIINRRKQNHMNTVQGEKSNKIGLIHCLDCSVKWNRLEKKQQQ